MKIITFSTPPRPCPSRNNLPAAGVKCDRTYKQNFGKYCRNDGQCEEEEEEEEEEEVVMVVVQRDGGDGEGRFAGNVYSFDRLNLENEEQGHSGGAEAGNTKKPSSRDRSAVGSRKMF